jgi:hypothetical protein
MEITDAAWQVVILTEGGSTQVKFYIQQFITQKS